MRLLIYGASDFTPTVIELVQACGHQVLGLIDDFNQRSGILGSLSEVINSHPPTTCGVVMAIGYNDLNARWNAWQRVRAAGYETPAIIHPNAYVANSANIELGSIIMAAAVIDVRVIVGEAAVIWPGACVSHDSRVGANCFLAPNSTLCGFVQLGANSYVGAGAGVVERTDVPDGTFIKMLSIYPRRFK